MEKAAEEGGQRASENEPCRMFRPLKWLNLASKRLRRTAHPEPTMTIDREEIAKAPTLSVEESRPTLAGKPHAKIVERTEYDCDIDPVGEALGQSQQEARRAQPSEAWQ